MPPLDLPRSFNPQDCWCPRTKSPAHTFASESPLPDGAIVLEHERIPFVSYPYEWTFDMLREAALLQLEIVERSLKHRMDTEGRDCL